MEDVIEAVMDEVVVIVRVMEDVAVIVHVMLGVDVADAPKLGDAVDEEDSVTLLVIEE